MFVSVIKKCLLISDLIINLMFQGWASWSSGLCIGLWGRRSMVHIWARIRKFFFLYSNSNLKFRQEKAHSCDLIRRGRGVRMMLNMVSFLQEGVNDSKSSLRIYEGMEVKKEIGVHHHDPIPPVKRHRMTEDALPNLGVADRFADGHRSNFVGGLRPRFLACRMTDYTVT